MNKTELINEVAKVVSTKKEAQEAVDCVFSSITKAMKTGDTVTLIGFGTFKVVDRKARKGRNPQTGEEIDIKASKAPKFTPGKALNEAVRDLFNGPTTFTSESISAAEFFLKGSAVLFFWTALFIWNRVPI